MNWIKNHDNQGKLTVALALLMAMAAVVLLPLFISIPQSQSQAPSLLPGQSATLLADGTLLLIGGEAGGGSLRSAAIWNPATGSTTRLSGRLEHGRAWHTATMLPDGTVLVFGGVGSNGQVLSTPEIFDPETSSFSLSPSALTMAPRSHHTATLLTDGHLLVAGGVGQNGETLASAQLWDSLDSSPAVQLPPLIQARRGHTATLLDDGNVHLQGGVDNDGNASQGSELFDSSSQRFSTAIETAESVIRNPILVASIPVSGSVDVPIDAVISLRFSKPLRIETINANTVTLSGPQGIEAAKVVPAEGGMLAFITPEADLLPGATYSLTVNGAQDREGLLLPVSGIRFSTTPLASPSQPPSGPPSDGGGSPASGGTPSSLDDDLVWRGQLRDGKPYSEWQDLPPLQAPRGVTALSGQVLNLGGLPLANVTLELEYSAGGSTGVETDETGRFLLTELDPGWRELIIDGRRARLRRNPQGLPIGPDENHGVFEYGLEITAGKTTVLSFTVWLPKIDVQNAVKIDSPTSSEVVVTTPKVAGLELRIPPGAVIYDHEYQVVDEVSLTPIPLDRTPFPLAKNVEVPLYFTAQPGGAYIRSASGIGTRIIYPNHTTQPPGARFNLWHYDTEPRGWYIYGLGTVSPDGKQVVPDPGVSIYKFSGAMFNGGAPPPPPPPPPCPPGVKCDGGDPVDLATGLFVMKKTDLYLPDILPIQLTRTYRPGDSTSRPFGIGTTHPYAMFLWSGNMWFEADLITPDGGRIHYTCIAGANCSHWTTAQLEHTSSQTEFYKSKIVWNGNGWDLTLKNGTVYVLGENAPLQAIRDRNGNQITITRTGGQTGNITKITTNPTGRWVEFTYDTSNRITQAKDNIGRTVTYTYDASGRLETVTDPAGGVTRYTYDAAHRVLTLKDPRQIVFLTNEYDVSGRVVRQTQADGSIYQFAYTNDATGKIIQTDVTDPRGNVRRVTFNGDGQIVTDTYALGKPEEQATTYNRQSGTNLALSVTDPLNRTTSYTYNSMGNVTSVMRLAGTADAVTTTFTYEAVYNQVITVTDPLNHTTTFRYDLKGNLISTTNPLNQTTTLTRNGSGQVISRSDPLNNTTQFTYEFGDFVTTTDPLGNTTIRVTDLGGRAVNVTNPIGNPTIYDYDLLNRLTQTTDPLNGVTAFGYDPNGNLLSVTDARSNATTYTYDNMDRLATRVDPLIRSESYQYDLDSNMTQFTDRKSQATAYSYDALNRRTGVTYADTSTTAYTYDAGNRLMQVVDSIAGTITRSYDGLNRLTSETTPQGSVSYTYDTAGRRASMSVSGQSSVVYSYDNSNRLTQITQGSSTVSYIYDAAGRRTSLTLPNGVLVEYSYDTASRLTEIKYKQNGTTLLGNLTYEYDKNGNRTKIGGTFARTGLPQGITLTAYNAANHQTTFGDKTLTYDNNGNLQTITDGSGTTTYTWNARNQLTGISGPGVSASFVYDGLGRREKKTINGSLTEFLYDGVNPVQETSGVTVLANILTGLGIDEHLTRADVVAGTTSHILPDALGSTLALADAAGAVQTEYTYEPFGRTTTTGVSNSNPLQYTGRENDSTGLYYYRARYYHPGLQRFISEDSIELYGGDTNLYAYVHNDPLGFVDPFGLDKKPSGPFVPGVVLPFPPGGRGGLRPPWMGSPLPPGTNQPIPLFSPPPPPFAWPEPIPLIVPNVNLFNNYLDYLRGTNAPGA